jgi:hypothetical protein
MPKNHSDDEFIAIWGIHKSPAKVAKALDVDIRQIYRRRKSIEIKHKIKLETELEDITKNVIQYVSTAHTHNARQNLGILNGTVIVFSDAHFWPNERTTAYKGLLWAIENLQPNAVINNGDAFDGASISRYPRIGWDSKPTVREELRACETALGEIEEYAKIARHNVKLVWPLGNHDSRFENMLAQHAGQFEGVQGFSLKDHFPAWIPCWSCWVNETVVVKHRWKGGVHATHNNTVNSGTSFVTGHLHSLKVTPFTDYNGTRYGVDTGTLADIDGKQFVDYLEDSPVNWRSGFAILTIKDGKLIIPELVQKWSENNIEFRGEVINVKAY